jgi:prepilin-type N-terminal cleavage/methylation domain-containing protein
MSAHPERNGFTLVEALIVLVVSGILAALALPSLVQAVSRQGAWNARASAISLFSWARASAQETGRPTTLAWSANVAMVTAAPRLTTGPGTMDTIGRPVDFGSLYGVTVSGTPATAVTLDPHGLATSAGTTVFFVRDGVRDSVVVSGYGRIIK